MLAAGFNSKQMKRKITLLIKAGGGELKDIYKGLIWAALTEDAWMNQKYSPGSQEKWMHILMYNRTSSLPEEDSVPCPRDQQKAWNNSSVGYEQLSKVVTLVMNKRKLLMMNS